MTDQAMDDVAQSSEDTSAGNLGPENVSSLEAVANRIKAQEQAPETQLLEAPEVEEEETTEEEVPEVDTETTEDADDVEVEDEDPEELSDEEKEFIEANPQSRLAKRIGTLTRKRKEAEERATKSEEQLQTIQAQQQTQVDPFAESAPKAELNPFRELETVESLQEKFGELTNFIKWADSTLDDHDDATNDEVIYEEGENSFTKKEVKARLRQVREEKETFLPARYNELRQAESLKAQETQLDQRARTEIAWMADEDSEGAKKLASIKANPKFDEIRRQDPTVDYMLAHAINSIENMGKKKAPAKMPEITPAKPKPPGSPQGSSAAPRKSASSISKQQKQLQQEYYSTGTSEALVALRTFNHQNNL